MYITNPEALFIPECVTVQATITAPKEISALELVPTATGARLGHIASLPKGTRLEICGGGFNERTVKARCQGHFYFVFLQDIETFERVREADAENNLAARG
ncbi:MAG: hypothetical protein JO061_00540 [Acidobacteriaceae bacterium]|nr:hypothetical protein [Acidobacteriaceae bacterium]